MEALNVISSYKIFSHGLCTDIDGKTSQLWGVLELPVECSQVHWQEVILGESWLLER